MIPVIVHIPNSGSLPIAARAAPAWLGSSVLLVAVFGAVLGLLGVIILVLILYIYKKYVMFFKNLLLNISFFGYVDL